MAGMRSGLVAATLISLGTMVAAVAPVVAHVTITEYSAGITPGAQPFGITAGPDGALWFAESNRDRIGRITSSGVVTEYSAGITPGAGPLWIAAGPDGALWFTEVNGNRIGRITTAGVATEYSTGITLAAGPIGITAGPDGALWFSEEVANRIGRVTTSQLVSSIPVLSGFGLLGLAALLAGLGVLLLRRI